MKYLLIFNPTAYQGKSGKRFAKILNLLKIKNVTFEYLTTSKKDEAIELAAQATKEKFDVVVAVGGDGTICEVITGLMQQTPARRAKLGVIHIGTSPDFNRYHNLPVKLEDAVRILIQGKTEKIDVGKVTHLDLEKEEIVSYFGSSVNMGLGPNIASKSNGRYRKFLGDFAGTLCSTLVSLVEYKSSDFQLIIDGKQEEVKGIFNLTVGKDPYLASGMRVPLDITPDDGRMFCLAISGSSKMPLLMNLWKLYAGNILDYSGANLKYCKEVEIKPNRNSMIEFDGDFRGYLPAKVQVIPKTLEVIVN
ncbi:MAG: diacylglycerol kinase family protein [bacterium]